METEYIIAAVVAVLGPLAARYGVRLRVYRKHLVVSLVVPAVRGAITLPVPFARAVLVVYGRPAMLRSEGYAYLRVHEWTHVDQSIALGWRSYYRQHVGWRFENAFNDGKLTWDDIWAIDHPLERAAYERQKNFLDEIDGLSLAEFRALPTTDHYPPITHPDQELPF